MKKERIMIVENEIATARSLQKSLEKLGYIVTSVLSSGEQAIQKIEEESHTDLVLIDFSLQGRIDGMESARIINTRFDLPVIYLTSYVENSVFEKAKSTNPYGYLTKPFKKNELQKVIELGLYRHRTDEDRRMLVTELKNEIVERNRIEKELEMRVRQQDVIAHLGHKALLTPNPIDFMNEVVKKVADTLCNEYCDILELLPGGTHMMPLSGVGWKKGLSGYTRIQTGSDTLEGYTLKSSKPVIVDNLKTETRFSGTQLLHEHNIVSGMSIIIQGHDGPWGVLETHSTTQKSFSKNDINFLHSAANLLASTIAHKKADEKLIEKSREIEKINNELKDFVYTVSHDLKEPLFSINGYITRLYEAYQDIYDEKGRKFSNRIKANIEIMSNRIQEILEVAKIGMITYDFKDNSSGNIVRNVLASLEDQIESNNIKTSIKENLPTILCDEKRIRDVFFNLVTNAIKFMGDDKQREITIGCERIGDYYKFFVEDTGIGIRKEYHENVFRIFRRLKEVEAEQSGVGLIIVKKIIEHHKGKIWIESPIAREKGTRFCFTIPEVQAMTLY